MKRSFVIWVRYRGEFPMHSYKRQVDSMREHRHHVRERREQLQAANHIFKGAGLYERLP